MSKRVRLFPCVVMVALCLVVPAVASAVPSLWASDGIATDLFELDALTGAVLNTIPGPGVFRDALSFDTDGQSIWILDSSNNSTVFHIDLTGAILTSFFVPLDAEGLTILADGSLIVGGGTSGLVANIDRTSGAILSSFAPNSNLFGLASNGTDRLFGLTINGVIETYDLSGTLLDSLATGVSGTTLGLAYTGSSFFVASVTTDLIH